MSHDIPHVDHHVPSSSIPSSLVGDDVESLPLAFYKGPLLDSPLESLGGDGQLLGHTGPIVPTLSRASSIRSQVIHGVDYFEDDEALLEHLAGSMPSLPPCHHKLGHRKVLAIGSTLADPIPSSVSSLSVDLAPLHFEEGNAMCRGATQDIVLAPDKIIKVGAEYTPDEVREYSILFREFRDVFVWDYSDMKGIDPSIVTHNLTTVPNARPVRQKQRPLHLKLSAAVKIEVEKLVDARLVSSINYPKWVSNIVPIAKKNGTIRIYVDFSDINNAYPKDNFLLPFIDQIIDRTARFEVISLMDGFSGYNQIQISPEDYYKTAFAMPWGTFAYKAMPFGLKNVGATYQRAMHFIFHDLINNTLEVFMDDMMGLLRTRAYHPSDLCAIFTRCRKYHVSLNPLKCVFAVTSGKLLGFLMSQQGIQIDPKKVKAILDMPPPRTQRQIESFLGRLGFLRHFLANFAINAKPLTNLLKKEAPFIWSNKTQKAFVGLKEALVSAPTLAPPRFDRPPRQSTNYWHNTRTGGRFGNQEGYLFHQPHSHCH